MTAGVVPLRALALIVVVAAIAVACGGGTAPTTTVAPSPASTPAPSSAPTPAPTAAAEGAVNIVDNGFAPGDITVKAGATVTWTHTGQRPHTVTSTDGGFTSSGTLSGGSTYQQTFATAGTFAYVCSIHGSMKGTVTVAP